MQFMRFTAIFGSTVFFAPLVTLWCTPRGVGLGMLLHGRMQRNVLQALALPSASHGPFKRHNSTAYTENGYFLSRGAACSNSRPQPPPPPPHPLQTPPKFSNPSFFNLRFWRKGSAPKARVFFFFALPEGFFFKPSVSFLKILRILWRTQKCLKNAENHLEERSSTGAGVVYPLFWGHSRSIPQGMIFDVPL